MVVSTRSVGRAGAIAWACALGVTACGHVRSDDARWSPQGGNSSFGGGVASGGAAFAGNSGSAGNGGSAGTAGSGGALAGPRPSQARRLTASEYQATVTDVLGTSTQVDVSAGNTYEDGFDNVAADNGVNDRLLYRYLDSAEILANEVFASDVLRARIVTCTQTDDVTCVRQIITQAGLRLFRRPLLEDEIASYKKVYVRARARALDHNGALKDVLVALLVSAQFVYRLELVPTAPGTQPLTSYDIATRLSYLLWSSAPDEELLNAAAQDTLQKDDALTAEVTRLVQDPKGTRFSQNFAGQWLDTRRLPEIPVPPPTFPEWTRNTAIAAGAEVQAYFDEIVRQDAPWPSFLSGRAHFVNTDLGKLYGLEVLGPVTQRVELNGVDRQGFLGMVGFLVVTSQEGRSEPSRRGAWVSARLLCSTLPPTPLDMPSYPKAGSDGGIRSYLEALSPRPECASCHAAIDPIGLALENYDAVGRYRMMYADAPIDAGVTLSPQLGVPGDQHVVGLAGLSNALATSPALTACAAQMLHVYGMGRVFTDSERPNVEALAKQWQGGPLTMRNLVLSFVHSSEFRSRSDGGDL